jgi:hypothetical protein
MRENIFYYAQIINTYAPCIVVSSRWNNIVNMEIHCATTDVKVWSKKILSICDEAFILRCFLINYGKRWFGNLAKAEKMVRKQFVLLFVSAAANILSIFLSIQQKKDQWTEEDSKYLPVSVYPVKKINKKLKRRRLKPASLQNFPAPTYTFSRNKGAHDNWGGCGWSEPGMRKYHEIYTAIKNDTKKSAPKINQELLKMFLSQQKKESGRGTKKLFDQKGKKRPYKCMDK